MTPQEKIAALRALAGSTQFEHERQRALEAADALEVLRLAEIVEPKVVATIRLSEPNDDRLDHRIIESLASLAEAEISHQNNGYSAIVSGTNAAAGRYLVREYFELRMSTPRERREALADALEAMAQTRLYALGAGIQHPAFLQALEITHRALRKQAP